MIRSTRVTITTEPQQVVAPSANPQRVKFINAGAEVIRIGGSADVSPTLAFGIPRLPDNPNTARNVIEIDLHPQEEIWAVVVANTADLNIWVQSTL